MLPDDRTSRGLYSIKTIHSTGVRLKVKNFNKVKGLLLLGLLALGFTGLDLVKESVLNGQVNWDIFFVGLAFILLAILAIIIYVLLEKEQPDRPPSEAIGTDRRTDE